MSVRTDVVEAIRQRMPEGVYDYLDSHEALGAIERPVIAVALKQYLPANLDQGRTLDAEFIVLVATPTMDPRFAEIDLDAHVADLLTAIARGPAAIRWTQAMRGTEEGYHGWDITLRVLCTITPDPNTDSADAPAGVDEE